MEAPHARAKGRDRPWARPRGAAEIDRREARHGPHLRLQGGQEEADPFRYRETEPPGAMNHGLSRGRWAHAGNCDKSEKLQ